MLNPKISTVFKKNKVDVGPQINGTFSKYIAVKTSPDGITIRFQDEWDNSAFMQVAKAGKRHISIPKEVMEAYDIADGDEISSFSYPDGGFKIKKECIHSLPKPEGVFHPEEYEPVYKFSESFKAELKKSGITIRQLFSDARIEKKTRESFQNSEVVVSVYVEDACFIRIQPVSEFERACDVNSFSELEEEYGKCLATYRTDKNLSYKCYVNNFGFIPLPKNFSAMSQSLADDAGVPMTYTAYVLFDELVIIPPTPVCEVCGKETMATEHDFYPVNLQVSHEAKKNVKDMTKMIKVAGELNSTMRKTLDEKVYAEESAKAFPNQKIA